MKTEQEECRERLAVLLELLCHSLTYQQEELRKTRLWVLEEAVVKALLKS